MAASKHKPGAVVIPNWNGEQFLGECLESLMRQTHRPHIIVVDNGSVDTSVELVRSRFPDVTLVELPKNTGFTGGVNAGIRLAMEQKEPFIALLNNDAVAEPGWFAALAGELEANPEAGIVTSKITDLGGKKLDSTGEFYTIWGLPFSRGRGETNLTRYDHLPDIFAASGGASIYRTSMLEQIGIFDDDFFAYYEDVDISFRAQLRGWRVRFAPRAVVRHRIGATSGKIKGFTTLQTLKNLPLVAYKNVPARLLPSVLPRLWLAHALFFWSAVARGQGGIAARAVSQSLLLTPKKLWQRRGIQRTRTVTARHVGEALLHTLPPDAERLRKFVHPIKFKQNRNTP